MSCHTTVAPLIEEQTPVPSGTARMRTVALIGPPNCGKSTLFNRLTGMRQKVANYPGVTVEHHSGRMKSIGRNDLTLIDLPGTSVEVLRRAPAGDPRVYRIDGVEVGLRNETAKHIFLRLTANVSDEAA